MMLKLGRQNSKIILVHDVQNNWQTLFLSFSVLLNQAPARTSLEKLVDRKMACRKQSFSISFFVCKLLVNERKFHFSTRTKTEQKLWGKFRVVFKEFAESFALKSRGNVEGGVIQFVRNNEMMKLEETFVYHQQLCFICWIGEVLFARKLYGKCGQSVALVKARLCALTLALLVIVFGGNYEGKLLGEIQNSLALRGERELNLGE